MVVEVDVMVACAFVAMVTGSEVAGVGIAFALGGEEAGVGIVGVGVVTVVAGGGVGIVGTVEVSAADGSAPPTFRVRLLRIGRDSSPSFVGSVMDTLTSFTFILLGS